MINSGNGIYVQIPFKYDSIRQIDVTCFLHTEHRTKKFHGQISGNKEKYIFSKVERSMGEKIEVSEFVEMERFLV